MAYVYCHIKADSGEPFYVGMGKTKRRPWTMSARSDWHKNIVAKHGIRVEIIIDEIDWDEALWWEVRWIKTLKDAGYNLVNQTPGGEGGPTWTGKTHTEETKKKMSIAAKGNKGNLGKVFSEEHRRRLSASQLGNKKSLGHKDTKEAREKKSAAMIGKKHALGWKWTEEQRVKNIEARRGQKRTEEQKQKMRDAWVARKLNIKGGLQ